MELDELKRELAQTEPQYSRSELESIFEIKTRNTVKNMDKIMRYDLITMVLVTVAMVSITFYAGLENRYFISMQIVLLATALFLHFSIKRKVIYKQLASRGIMESIEKTLAKTITYIRVYKIIIPLIISSLHIKTSVDIASAFDISSHSLLLFLLTVIPLFYGTYLFTNWLSKKMYGSAVDKLKFLRQQLSSQTLR